uniref:Uncharacterized protein n=1 Tax=Brassica oleracea TaxID=3712 RepID=A0A3P6GQJ7_BRAOL|nr:unnamed protein product [Brassica oleracea]
MGRYSYSQPSQSEDMFGNNSDSEYSETEDLIRRDQAELSLGRRSSVIYPPQPEVEFRFPQVCYCGSPPQLVASRSINGEGRLVYTCANKDDGECHLSSVCDNAKERSVCSDGFEYVVGAMVVVLILTGLGIMYV